MSAPKCKDCKAKSIFMDMVSFMIVALTAAAMFLLLCIPIIVLAVLFYILSRIYYSIFLDGFQSGKPKECKGAEAKRERELDMPALAPILIPTKKHDSLDRHIAWMNSVRKWELVENWQYRLSASCTEGDREITIVIPKGFVFDGASIPRPFWAILHPSGLLLIPALVHDFAYRYGFLWEVVNPGKVCRYRHKSGCKNKKAKSGCKKAKSGCKKSWDKLFRKIGDEVNGVNGVNWVAWLAVYAFGRSAWNKNDETRKKANCRERLACQCRPPDGYDDIEQSNTEQSDCQMNDRPENGGNDLPKPK